MKLVDVHAHLDFEEYDKDREEVIADCEKAGVKAIIVNGIHPKSNAAILELAKKHSVIKPALGFYPTEVISVSEKEFQEGLKQIKENKPIAIGEVGLDKKWAEYNPEEKYELQKERFIQIIKLAQNMNKPLIIHSRKAEQEVIELLEEHKVRKAVFHCFMGKKKLVERIIANKWSMSIPANAFKVHQFQQNIKMLPLSQILTETDSPYLSGSEERNTPANVAKTIELIAELKGLSKEDAANQVFLNYQTMFS